LPALLALSRAVLFPVGDLRGKVDVPISVLEAMRLEVPVVTLSGDGPLSDLEGVARCSDGDAQGLANAALRLVRDVPYREAAVVEASRFVDARHDASVVARAYESIYDDVLRHFKS
jgi:phosphatidylinositol alpha-1,6-mannosyltransferase